MAPEHAEVIEGEDDRAALEHLYRTELDAVYGFLLVRSGSTHLAEDLTTEVFMEAARACARGQAADIRTGWLITVAKRRLIDHWRRVKRRQLRLQRMQQQHGPVQPMDLGDETVDRWVTDALDSLGVHQRAALTMRYLDGCSVTEVAESLDLSYRAAESLLARARRAFQAAYKEMS